MRRVNQLVLRRQRLDEHVRRVPARRRQRSRLRLAGRQAERRRRGRVEALVVKLASQLLHLAIQICRSSRSRTSQLVRGRSTKRSRFVIPTRRRSQTVIRAAGERSGVVGHLGVLAAAAGGLVGGVGGRRHRRVDAVLRHEREVGVVGRDRCRRVEERLLLLLALRTRREGRQRREPVMVNMWA